MVDAPRRAFAFDPYAAKHAVTALTTPGVTIASQHLGAMLNVRGNPRDADFMRDASAAFGVVLPTAPNTAVGEDHMRALWLGPDEWLIVSPHPLPPGEGPGVREWSWTREITNATMTDVSHGRAVLRLCGPDARAALAKGCPLDLDPRHFPVDACAQTAIAKINVILDHVQPDIFDLYCPRSYAGSLWHFLTEAAAEYGCNVARPK